MAKPVPLHAQRKAVGRSPDGNRLQPMLLDRLTDHQPTERREVERDYVLTRTMLRESVLRDLRWLLNTTYMETTDNLAAFPHIRKSVVNFGIAALAGHRVSELEWTDIESTIREAITRFEPRIVAESLSIRCLPERSLQGQCNLIALEISGDLKSMPVSTEFLFRSEIDLESGHIVLRSLGDS